MHVSELDEVLCSQPRLAIMLSLAMNTALSFMDLKRLTGLADGNLHVQTRKLQDMKYIEIEKTGSGRKSRTTFRSTDRGAYKLHDHLRKLNHAVNRDANSGSTTETRPHTADDSQVW